MEVKTLSCSRQATFLSLPQFADIVVVLAVIVGAGVGIRRSGVGGNYGIGAVLTGCCSTCEREDTADSEGRGTGSRATSSETGALTRSVAGSVETSSSNTGVIWELYYLEN